jgi:inhibitor of KinA sporulation pathway (predicted exonuclease)
MIRLALDLELNQPSNSIISIGAVAFNSQTGEILDKFHEYVHTSEQISEYITKLTGITQDNVANASDIGQVYTKLNQFKDKYQTHYQTVVWGSGDMRLLKEQVHKHYSEIFCGSWDISDMWWRFGRTEMNVKNVHQAIREANEKTIQGGLAGSIKKYGINFRGQKHNSADDAENTALIYCEILKKLKGLV